MLNCSGKSFVVFEISKSHKPNWFMQMIQIIGPELTGLDFASFLHDLARRKGSNLLLAAKDLKYP